MMKAIFNLPEELVREVEQCAAARRSTVDAVVADLLAMSLAARNRNVENTAVPVSKSLPLIKLRAAPASGEAALTPQAWCEWLKQIDEQSEVERYEKAFGHQHVDRTDG